MVSSSSSGREFLSANPSPETDTASKSSGGEYESVLEELQNDIAVQNGVMQRGSRDVDTLETQSSSSLARSEVSPMSMTGIVDVMVPLPQITRQSNHSFLSATASEFVPPPRRNMPTISEEERSLATHSRASSIAAICSRRPVYHNHTPGVPTHWVPVYGAGHGMFYNPVSKLFYGDGAPRPTIERQNGSIQPINHGTPIPPIGFQPEDVLHLQPPSMIDKVAMDVENDVDAVRRYYCRCKNAWLEWPHKCPLEWEGEDVFVDQTLPTGATTPIRPGDRIPRESITHDLAVGDLNYLTARQRYAYEHGLPMLMPSVTGRMSALQLQVNTRGVGTTIRK
ncbi:MAG: hypothetical protein Q9216_001955 [Gyalolechia sp. 2 TL-2023]